MKLLIFLFPVLCLFALISFAAQKDESDLQAFIKNHLKIVEPKLKAMNLAYWNAAASGEKK